MVDSILDSIKEMLGIELDDTAFDKSLVMFINGALAVMTQLGVGPTTGFRITGNSELWSTFIGDREDLEDVATDVYLRTRLIFDPPQNSFLVSSIEKQIAECDWRIEVEQRNTV